MSNVTNVHYDPKSKRAGYWPDVSRGQPKYDRPTWHYQVGSTLTIGEPVASNVPATPGPVSRRATLETQDLHIAQAIELCRRVMADRTSPAGDRAIALCCSRKAVGTNSRTSTRQRSFTRLLSPFETALTA